MGTSATAITVFHPVTDIQGFDEWFPGLLASAQAAEGFVSSRVSVHNDPRLDLAVAVTFGTQDLLDDWLDSPGRKLVLADGESRGFWPQTSDLVFVEGSVPPAGVGVFLHSVVLGKETDFEAAQRRIIEATAAFPGNEGTVVFPPDLAGEWMSVVRFRTGHQLSAWLQSQERAEALPAVRASLTRNFSEVSSTTPFGSTVRTENGQTTITPGWKTVMLLLLPLYPTAMLLSRFLGPPLDRLGAEPWLVLFVSNVISVALLQWPLMPLASAVFRRWLDPVEGAGWRVSLIGAAVLVVLYAATLLLFASVKSLQYWDFTS